jgi:hypothetical protein
MVPECRHIKTSGGKCASPALRDQPWCYFHARQRERAAERRTTPAVPLSHALSNLEDRSAIQHAITHVLMALADYQIDTKRAGILLYGLQLASTNAKDAAQIVASESVAELTRSEDGEEMAPEGATVRPQQEESIADMLMRELRSHLEGGKEPSSDQAAQPAENKELTRKPRGEGGSPPANPKPDAQISADRTANDRTDDKPTGPEHTDIHDDDEDEAELLARWPLDEFGHPKPQWNEPTVLRNEDFPNLNQPSARSRPQP